MHVPDMVYTSFLCCFLRLTRMPQVLVRNRIDDCSIGRISHFPGIFVSDDAGSLFFVHQTLP